MMVRNGLRESLEAFTERMRAQGEKREDFKLLAAWRAEGARLMGVPLPLDIQFDSLSQAQDWANGVTPRSLPGVVISTAPQWVPECDMWLPDTGAEGLEDYYG